MSTVRDFFSGLGAYAIPAIILFIELVAAIALTVGFFVLKKKRERFSERFSNVRKYCNSLSGNDAEAQVLLRRRDYYPIFATDNIKDLMGADAGSLESDVELLAAKADKNAIKEFNAKYKAWNGEGVLSLDFRRTDTYKWIRLSVTRSEDNEYDFFVFRDITADKAALEDMEARLRESEGESRYKTSFLSNMSHEIRTPMNGIIGMLSLARNHLTRESEADQYLVKAEELSQYLLSIINDILDMSRISAGKIELAEARIDIWALADKLRDMFQKNIEAKGIKFDIKLLDFDVRYVIGDELRLSQVLVNFLSNAQKFTEKGEITVTFRQMMKEDDSVNLMFRIHDTGIGMQPEFLSKIFRPFEQANASIAGKYGGSGLGMAITDQMVDLMGGKIVVDSMPGIGSDFTVYIAMPIAEDQTVSDAVSDDDYIDEDFRYDGMRILMAEDNEINAEVNVELLSLDGAEVETVTDGKQAVDTFAASEPGYYDIILMDVQMPVMDGREATRAIRRLDRDDAKTIPIFALSADAFVEDKNQSLSAGMDGHFSKPIDFDELRRGIGKFLRKHGR